MCAAGGWGGGECVGLRVVCVVGGRGVCVCV